MPHWAKIEPRSSSMVADHASNVPLQIDSLVFRFLFKRIHYLFATNYFRTSGDEQTIIFGLTTSDHCSEMCKASYLSGNSCDNGLSCTAKSECIKAVESSCNCSINFRCKDEDHSVNSHSDNPPSDKSKSDNSQLDNPPSDNTNSDQKNSENLGKNDPDLLLSEDKDPDSSNSDKKSGRKRSSQKSSSSSYSHSKYSSTRLTLFLFYF